MKKMCALALAVLLALSAVSAVAAEYTDKATVKKVQQALNDAGYDCGKPDGKAGKKTYAAVAGYQTDNGLTVTGVIDDELLAALGITPEEEVKKEDASKDLPHINFCGAELGATYGEIKGTLRMNYVYDAYMGPVTIDEIAVGSFSSIDYDSYILSRFAVGNYEIQDVAGFKPTFTGLRLVKPITNGIVSETEDDYIFYGAYYRFDDNDGDVKRIRQELKEKLTKLYGEPEKRRIEWTFGQKEKVPVFVWKGENNVEVTLTDSHKWISWVSLAYVWRGAEPLVKEALTLPRPDIDTEGNMNGL